MELQGLSSFLAGRQAIAAIGAGQSQCLGAPGIEFERTGRGARPGGLTAMATSRIENKPQGPRGNASHERQKDGLGTEKTAPDASGEHPFDQEHGRYGKDGQQQTAERHMLP